MRQRWGWGWFALFMAGAALNGLLVYRGAGSITVFSFGFAVCGMVMVLHDILETAIEKESLEKF